MNEHSQEEIEQEEGTEEHLTAPCGACGASLVYSARAKTLKCEYCGNEEEITGDLSRQIVEHDLEEALRSPSVPRGFGTESRTVSCSNCGAKVQVPADVVADSCDFCGSPRVAAQQEQPDVIRPESLVPFQIDSKTAKQRFRSWLAGLWFRPSDLKKLATVRELGGVYVPYWTFDAFVQSRWTASSGYYYYVTETYTATENGKSVTKTRQVRKIRWEPSSGSRSDQYDDLLVCASKGLPENLVEKLDTFETSKLVGYDPSYLSGWKAESYAVELPDAWAAGRDRMVEQQYSRCSSDVPGDTHRNLNVSNRFDHKTFKHVLLPIWIAAYQYRQETYRVLINGQTGEVEGKAPLSWVKIFCLVLSIVGVAGIIAAIVALSK